MGELHAKVPIVAIGDSGLIAEQNAGLWARVQEHIIQNT
jgi:hypothetical protein